MLATLSSATLSFFLVSISYAAEFSCVSGNLRQVEFGKIKTESAEYCFNKDQTILISKNCQSMTCEAFKGNRKYRIDELLSQMGKPAFKLCRNLGGQPELVEFSVSNRFYKLDRCLFRDGSFVDTDYLLSFYLKR